MATSRSTPKAVPPQPRISPVVGNAAQASPGTGSAGDGGWLAEITATPEAQPGDGVPVQTRSRGDTRRGRATEARRGQR